MRRGFFLALAIALPSCGGGSNGASSGIEGTWSGDLFQGVILCSDGTAIGAGGGTVVRSVELKVSGSDEVGSVVRVIDGSCLLQGTRDVGGFRADVVSGCEQGLDYIRLDVISQNEAGLSYQYDINKVPAGENGVRCAIAPSGTINR
jgi:hypothetical protein